MSPKASSRTRSPNAIPKAASPKSAGPDPSLINVVNSWEFKVTGRGTSGWMSWVKEGAKWVPLRASETSFVSAIAAIEPEIMRLAFPHRTTGRKAI